MLKNNPTPKKKAAAKMPGPKPETVQIEGDWKDAVKHAVIRGKTPIVRKEKPAGG